MLFTEQRTNIFFNVILITFIVNVWKIWERSCTNFSIIQLFSWVRTAKNLDKEANFCDVAEISYSFSQNYSRVRALVQQYCRP